ncbi:unnamed protein product [Cuscuta campestris]|uniref:BED-type domain-containing protein n=1 Tax=Cuscuta campestris TaxID=132261 RepID=A0A484NPJ9_9ASTE|nr:unnamed protein product [Cuscuta campestris]
MADQTQQSVGASSQSTANTNAITSEAVISDQGAELNAKKRKFTSRVWDYYDRECLGGGKVIATCLGCKQKFDGSIKVGVKDWTRNNLEDSEMWHWWMARSYLF